MTKPRSKDDTLSETAKTHVIDWYLERLYDRRIQVKSKYLDKGVLQEDASIAYLNDILGTEWTNNKDQFSDDYITGEPDIITDTEIIDIKNSWDFSTFPLFTKELKPLYYWQLQGYMHLLGKTKGRVIYTLMDTPEPLVMKEYELSRTRKPYDEFKKDYQYNHLPRHLRVKEFTVTYDPDCIEQVKTKVTLAREFINALSTKL